MNNFNDLEAIRKVDPQDTVGSTDKLVSQCGVAWKEVHELTLPNWDNFKPHNVVFCGMGASMYGGIVLKSLLGRNTPSPIEIVSDYHLPSYVNSNSLVVLTSYSGSTEETLSCAEEAKALGAKIIVLTKGGKLAEFAKTHEIPAYIFDGKLNPAGIPRLGNGYTIVGLLAMLNKLGVISQEERDIEEAFVRLHEKQADLKAKALTDSELFLGKIPVVLSGEHLTGNAHILRNQFNETSKTFSSYFLIPDLNHHLMEGLQFPEHDPLVFLSLQSENYAPKITQRFLLTKEVIQKNGYEVIDFQTSSQTVYDDFLETMLYGSYLSLYLGLRYDQNPAVNPWVDYFKKQLT